LEHLPVSLAEQGVIISHENPYRVNGPFRGPSISGTQPFAEIVLAYKPRNQKRDEQYPCQRV